MSDIKIFVTHTPNRNTMRVDNALLYNVIAGSDFQNKPVPSKVLRDNEGENELCIQHHLRDMIPWYITVVGKAGFCCRQFL